LFPVHIGNDVGMRTTSCGSAISSLRGHALSQYGPALGPVCQDHAQQRLVVWVGLLLPFVAAVGLAWLRRSRTTEAMPLDLPAQPRWPDALTFASMFFAAPFVARLVRVLAKDRALKRNAGRALELQVLPMAAFLWLIIVTRFEQDDLGTPSVLLGAALLFAVAGSVGSIACVVLALVNPARLERWEPLVGPSANFASAVSQQGVPS
jgi:hypothetical protein